MQPELSNKEKVAILLLNLGPDVAAEILKNFEENEIEDISDAIEKLKNVSDEDSLQVLNEFNGQLQSCRQTDEIINIIRDRRPADAPFRCLKHLTADEIISILAGEDTQLLALVLSYLEPQQSADIMRIMPEEMRLDLINKIVIATPPPVHIVKQVDELLKEKVRLLGDRISTPSEKKYRMIAEILNRSDSVTEKTVMQRIKEEDPSMAQEIRAFMFVFEDISLVEDKFLRQVLAETETVTIAMSLKTASKAVRDKIFKNMSKRMGEMVTEEQQMLGPKPLAEVEAAQKVIVDALSKLEAQGEKVRGKSQDLGPMV
ncbi:MAG: flagellar motor switch protein FliG [Candidatus Loosdrechtia sp.]|uniref:flagellar motor switch protein FliG n=1 Tax=Candidatus Loosdrechtia sp. TaxID=3101272 RepID=UPI003A694220|nr:MAG: FliG C-terminal domain-containing protein [Candidatus Jettenia sp. AMX2]